MNIKDSITQSKLRYKGLIYSILILSFIVGTILLFHIYDPFFRLLDLCVFIINNGLLVVYFIFFFNDRKKKTYFFATLLLLLFAESIADVFIDLFFISIYWNIFSRYILIVLLAVCYFILTIIALRGLYNKVLFLIISAITCVLTFPFYSLLNVSIMIFGLTNYLPIVVGNYAYNLWKKSDKTKLIILKEQFDDGIITEEEYKEKKKIIIDSL